MESLYASGKVEPNVIISYRGWDDPTIYLEQKFGTIFLPATYYYEDNNIFNYAVNLRNIDIIHIYNSGEVLNMGKRLQRNGIRIIFEVINIDHVLYSQFWSDKNKLKEITNMQKLACERADHVMCRSKVDKEHLVEMGISESKITIYRGAIDTNSIDFRTRIEPRYKILFLGHMYYPPNEEALKLIVNKVLPHLRKVNPRYSITIVGNTPKETIDEYKNVPGLCFLGGQDNISKFLQEYDIGIAPLYQGSGTRLKLLDYLASGLPVITTSLGVEGLLPEIKNHLTIENDIEEYALKIDHIMTDLNTYEIKSMKGRKFVEQYYDWSNAIDPFLNVYQNIIKSGNNLS